MHLNKLIIFVLSLCALASCKSPGGLFSNYQPADSTNVPVDLYRDVLSADTTSFGNMPWREVFTDPLLQQLIEKALAENTDIRKAELTIKQAEAGLMTSRLAFLPQIAFAPQGTISSFDFSKATKAYTLPIQASWQIDLFGTLRNAKKQSEQTLYMARAGKQATQTAIVAAVANLYYTLCMLDAQEATTTSTLALWDENVRTMDVMFQTGATTAAAVAQAKANRATVANSLPTLRNNIRATENALCELLHETSHAVPRGTLESARFPQSLQVGIPLQLLQNRPDVRAAELQLAYAYYGVLGAKGAFYPQLTLSGSAGWTNNAGMIVNPGKMLLSAIAGLTQPIFAQGKLRANLKISKLQQEAAQLDFEQQLLKAGNEVTNALGDYQTAIQRTEGDRLYLKEVQSAYESADFLFRNGGQTSYIETLSAQQGVLQAQLSLISDQFEQVQAVINLYQALGGGRE